MKSRSTILVIGGTGAQGGSVARALLNSRKYNVRILTRYPASAKALALKNEGAEIVQGDLEDMNSLREAMKNVYGVFGVTSYWEHFEKEYHQGKNLVEAVYQTGIKHFVFSTLPNYNKLSEGRFSVPQYDIKALLQNYARRSQLPATFLHASFYYENFLDMFPLQKDEDDNIWFGFPQGDAKLAMVSVEDIGGIVATMFEHPDLYIGRTVQAVGADETCDTYAAILSDVLEQKVYYKHISRDEYASYETPNAEEIANTFEVRRLFVAEKLVDMIESYALNPSMQNFRDWAVKNKGKLLRLINNQIQVMVD